jgi:hypothetical protein
MLYVHLYSALWKGHYISSYTELLFFFRKIWLIGLLYFEGNKVMSVVCN